MRREGKGLARRLLRAAQYVFLAAGLIALGYAGLGVLDMYFYQGLEMSKFETITATARAEPLAIEAAPIAEGGVIGEIEVPRLDLKAIVVQGDSERLLGIAVGHLPETALPGEAGNVALAGHRDGLFRPLRDVRPGDLITLRVPDREFQYQVQWTAIVPPTAVGVLQPTSEPALTLVTCFPFSYVGAAPERFVVRARKIGIAPRAPSAPPEAAEEPKKLEYNLRTFFDDRLRRLCVQSASAVMQQGTKLSSGLSAWLEELTSLAHLRFDGRSEQR